MSSGAGAAFAAAPDSLPLRSCRRKAGTSPRSEDPSFSASVLCSESRYGSKQIYRRIKQLTGLGIVEFIRDIRLRKAALYLSQGKFTVSEVMYKVGFTTASYFSKCFKEKYGVSPSEYRGK